MFTTLALSLIGTMAGIKKLTIDVICSQAPRLDDRKCANNEASEGVGDNLFRPARSGCVEDERIVIEPMKLRRSVQARCGVCLVDERKVEQAGRSTLLGCQINDFATQFLA